MQGENYWGQHSFYEFSGSEHSWNQTTLFTKKNPITPLLPNKISTTLHFHLSEERRTFQKEHNKPPSGYHVEQLVIFPLDRTPPFYFLIMHGGPCDLC